MGTIAEFDCVCELAASNPFKAQFIKNNHMATWIFLLHSFDSVKSQTVKINS
jgi:hypothetical protein